MALFFLGFCHKVQFLPQGFFTPVFIEVFRGFVAKMRVLVFATAVFFCHKGVAFLPRGVLFFFATWGEIGLVLADQAENGRCAGLLPG